MMYNLIIPNSMLNQTAIKKNNQSGQALLFVIIAMTIALSVGVAVSSRTINSLKRSSSTDTSSRVFAAAEGGIEWFLTQPLEILEDLSDGNNNNGSQCPSGSTDVAEDTSACQLNYEPQGIDKIESKAEVTVTKFQFNNKTGSDNYWFNLNTGEVKEVALQDYLSNTFYRGNIDICFRPKETTQSALLYYYTYNEDGVYEKKLIEPQGAIVGSIDVEGTTLANTTRPGYPECYRANIGTDLIGLRIKILYSDSEVAVFPDSANFPTQGYKLISKGRLENVNETIKVVREITAFKSLPYAPAVFDYAIYSQLPIN